MLNEHTDIQTQTHKHTYIHTDRQTETDRQTDKQSNTQNPYSIHRRSQRGRRMYNWQHRKSALQARCAKHAIHECYREHILSTRQQHILFRDSACPFGSTESATLLVQSTTCLRHLIRKKKKKTKDVTPSAKQDAHSATCSQTLNHF